MTAPVISGGREVGPRRRGAVNQRAVFGVIALVMLRGSSVDPSDIAGAAGFYRGRPAGD